MQNKKRKEENVQLYVNLCALCRDMAETGIDLFEDIIKDMFTLADAQDKGYVSREEFAQVQGTNCM